MLRLSLFFLLFSGCQKSSLLQDWSNVLNSKRSLKLQNGKLGVNKKALKLDENCHLDIKVHGRKDLGTIEILADKDSQNCHQEVPTQMQYHAIGKELKVCSDYKDGKHSCELMTIAK